MKTKTSVRKYLRSYSESLIHENIDFLESLICGYLTIQKQPISQPLSRDMSPRIAKQLLLIRDALIKDEGDEAYNLLYEIASPNFDKMHDEVWKEVESIASELCDAGQREEMYCTCNKSQSNWKDCKIHNFKANTAIQSPDKAIIAKQDELIKAWENLSVMSGASKYLKMTEEISRLESELAALRTKNQ